MTVNGKDQRPVVSGRSRHAGRALARRRAAKAPRPRSRLPAKATTSGAEACGAGGAASSATAGASAGSTAGSGCGGVRTPADDFAQQRRKSSWCRDGSSSQALPPRVYIDNKTLIREVQDLSTLKRGDHCVIAINVLWASTPFMDYLISWLGSIEICYLYHHFIVLHDVDNVDEAGVPRTADGEMAMIVEWGNTIPEACQEIITTTGRRLHQFPMVVMKFVFTAKAKFNKHPLANYGDTPHIYLVLEKKSAEERERTGLLALKVNQWAELSDMCYSAMCASLTWAMAVYHFFAAVPVALQAMISYILLMRSVLWQRRQALINRHECCHLLGKELGRVLVVGTWTILAIGFAPRIVSNFVLRLMICAFAYVISDMVYNWFVHAFMRLVLLPIFGSVWLLGPRDDAKEKAS